MAINQEVRQAAEGKQTRQIELRASASDFAINARAIKYGAVSQDPIGGRFYERIAPGAFSDSIKRGDEIVCLLSHSDSAPLGRTGNGTLRLSDSPASLDFYCKLNKNVQAHKDVYELLKDQTLQHCSFCFTTDDQTWDDNYNGTGLPLRTVKHGRIYDVSVVSQPAYGGTATMAEARAVALANGRKAVGEVIEMLRRAARAMSPKRRDAGAGDEMALVRDHLAAAHEAMENAFACSDTARQMSDAFDVDDSDEDDEYKSAFRAFRVAHREAHGALNECCNQMAATRLAQPQRKKK